MPFQGDPKAGSMDPTVLSFLLNAQNQRAKLEMQMRKAAFEQQLASEKEQREAAAAARKEQREIEAHRLKMSADEAALFGPRKENLGQAARVAAEIPGEVRARTVSSRVAQRDPNNLVAFANAYPSEATAFALNQLAATDPTSVIQQGNAVNSLRGLTGDPVTDDYILKTASDLGISIDEVLFGGVAQNAVVERQRLTEEAQDRDRARFDKSLELGNSRRLARFNDALRDENVRTDREAVILGDMDAVGTLQANRNAIRRSISQLDAKGEDTADLREQISVIDGKISAIQNPSTVRQISPIPFEQREKIAQQFAGADFTLQTVDRLFTGIEQGKVALGATGALVNLRERGKSLIEQALLIDPTFAESEVGVLAKEAVARGENVVDVSEQLTLGLDQLSLAYGFSRMGRGNARFTIKEMTAIAEQFDFTGLFTTEQQIIGALRKVTRAAVQEKAVAYMLLGDDPDFRERLRTVENLPEDREFLERLERGVTAPPVFKGNQSGGKRLDPTKMSDRELLEELGL